MLKKKDPIPYDLDFNVFEKANFDEDDNTDKETVESIASESEDNVQEVKYVADEEFNKGYSFILKPPKKKVSPKKISPKKELKVEEYLSD